MNTATAGSKPVQRVRWFLLVCLFLVFSENHGQSIDEEQSKVGFRISNMGFNTVKGTFTGMEGSINFDENNPEMGSFKVCVDAKSVNTDNKKRDEHLRNEAFFDVEQFPTICFKSSKIEKEGSDFKTTGTLEMHGAKRIVKIPFAKTENGLKGTLSINRNDFSLGESYGSFMVGEEVEIEILCIFK